MVVVVVVIVVVVVDVVVVVVAVVVVTACENMHVTWWNEKLKWTHIFFMGLALF